MRENKERYARVDKSSFANSPLATTAGSDLPVQEQPITPDIDSPLPWAVQPERAGSGDWLVVDTSEGGTIATTMMRDDAAYIVRACNSYPALVAALRAALEVTCAPDACEHDPDEACCICLSSRDAAAVNVSRIAREALKVAEGR